MNWMGYSELMGIFEGGNIDKKYIAGCTTIIAALGLVGYFWWRGMGGEQTVVQTGQQAEQRMAGKGEGTDDCFIPKQGDAPCIVDIVGAEVERFPSGDLCQGVEVKLEVNTELVALDPQTRGEVVIQAHPPGGSNDGSSDTGVGIGRYSDWSVFRFGPGGSQPPEGNSHAEIDGKNATLKLNSFADGSCITEGSELRVKLQMESSSGDPIYDILGFSGGLMEYHTIEEYMEVFGSQ